MNINNIQDWEKEMQNELLETHVAPDLEISESWKRLEPKLQNNNNKKIWGWFSLTGALLLFTLVATTLFSHFGNVFKSKNQHNISNINNSNSGLYDNIQDNNNVSIFDSTNLKSSPNNNLNSNSKVSTETQNNRNISSVNNANKNNFSNQILRIRKISK